MDKLWVLSNWKKNYEIGLVLSGKDYVVFDFDDMKIYERFKISYPSIEFGITETSVTGRGVHVYFQNTEELIQALGIIPGLDIKASKNNFVVVNPNTDLEEVNELPEELWGFYEANKNNAQKESKTVDINDFRIHELDMIVEGFGPEGTRNRNISLLVWTLISLGFDERQLKEVVNLANSRSGLPDSEIEKTIETSWRKWTNGS